jgi:hypothetical protein
MLFSVLLILNAPKALALKALLPAVVLLGGNGTFKRWEPSVKKLDHWGEVPMKEVWGPGPSSFFSTRYSCHDVVPSKVKGPTTHGLKVK